MAAAAAHQRGLATSAACVFVLAALQALCFGLTTTDDDLLHLPNTIPVTYHEIHTELHSVTKRALPRSVQNIALESYTPFCTDYEREEPDVHVEPECVRWEEQELDLLLMYIDLLSSGMTPGLAQKFYEEVRCLSRANKYPVPELEAWEVCFSRDFSDVLGRLLAKYIQRDAGLQLKLDLTVSRGLDLNATTRFSFGRVHRGNRGSFLRGLFGSTSMFTRYTSVSARIEKACCRSCSHRNYFVNIEKDQCWKHPKGKHCCHKACKALARLKVGASSSVSFCCRNCNPQRCRS